LEFGPSHAAHFHLTVRVADSIPSEEERLLTKIIREETETGVLRVMSQMPFSESRHFLSSFKNSSLVNPACCMIESSVPSLMVS
jgi:hypothetical protein